MRPDSVMGFTDQTTEEAVFQALGAASACWDNLEGAGEFDSTKAKQIGDELVAYLQGEADEADEIAVAGDRVGILLDAGANGLWVEGTLVAVYAGEGDTDGLLHVLLDGDPRPTNIYERHIVMLRREPRVRSDGVVE